MRNRHTRRLAVLVSTTLIASGIAIITGQTSASASEAVCQSSVNNNPNPPYASARCTGTTKYYRVVAECEENLSLIHI